MATLRTERVAAAKKSVPSKSTNLKVASKSAPPPPVKKKAVATKSIVKEKSMPKKKSQPSAKASRPSPAGGAGGGPLPIWEGPPDEALEGGWPDGWVKKVFQRKSGQSKGSTDRYWYTPIQKYKLRSMVEVKKFIRALEQYGGDEMAAKKNFKNL